MPSWPISRENGRSLFYEGDWQADIDRYQELQSMNAKSGGRMLLAGLRKYFEPLIYLNILWTLNSSCYRAVKGQR